MKEDYPPLFGPGRHRLSLREIADKCVTPFNSEKRAALFSKIEILVNILKESSIPCEVWINGSFVTEKDDPDDVDLSIMINCDVVDSLDLEQSALIDKLNSDDENAIPDLSIFVSTVYPIGKANNEEGIDEGKTWAEHWTSEHGQYWLKGFIVLRVLETDVGLRICS